jgi:hypothetical protein
VEEEAAFWDAHSPLDYPDTWVPAKEARSRPGLQHMLAVRVDADRIAALGAVARKNGVGPSTLARMWPLERLA